MYSSIESSCCFLNELLKKEKTLSTAADEGFTRRIYLHAAGSVCSLSFHHCNGRLGIS